ncbi:MAG TPA: transposase, partial [Spirochaetota bacterium]|nr:transposase [Spirochaetota bacterium]HPM35686.1 transposase [Spirochaetota bacterium]
MSKKNYTAEEKFKIVKEALTTSTPVSEVCRKYSIHPNNFYNWQKLFFESALEGFNVKRGRPNTVEAARAAELEKENQRMKDVIAEITSENILLKKSFRDRFVGACQTAA